MHINNLFGHIWKNLAKFKHAADQIKCDIMDYQVVYQVFGEKIKHIQQFKNYTLN